uniref:Uncharacterized protein n=1 Tax=Arundo donax TaxID=35708 RepID=A0A0A9HCI5_ARUDO
MMDRSIDRRCACLCPCPCPCPAFD